MSKQPTAVPAKDKEEPLAPPRLRQPPHPKYTPNITPLIDVLFLLLLFFVLASKFRQNEGTIPGSLPPPDRPSESKVTAPPVILEVRGDGEDALNALYCFSGESEGIQDPEIVYRQLKQRFEQDFDSPRQAAEDGIVIIRHYNTRWRFVVDAYNQAARAGYKKISFQQG